MLGWVFIDHSVTGGDQQTKYDYTRYRSVVPVVSTLEFQTQTLEYMYM